MGATSWTQPGHPRSRPSGARSGIAPTPAFLFHVPALAVFLPRVLFKQQVRFLSAPNSCFKAKAEDFVTRTYPERGAMGPLPAGSKMPRCLRWDGEQLHVGAELLGNQTLQPAASSRCCLLEKSSLFSGRHDANGSRGAGLCSSFLGDLGSLVAPSQTQAQRAAPCPGLEHLLRCLAQKARSGVLQHPDNPAGSWRWHKAGKPLSSPSTSTSPLLGDEEGSLPARCPRRSHTGLKPLPLRGSNHCSGSRAMQKGEKPGKKPPSWGFALGEPVASARDAPARSAGGSCLSHSPVTSRRSCRRPVPALWGRDEALWLKAGAWMLKEALLARGRLPRASTLLGKIPPASSRTPPRARPEPL